MAYNVNITVDHGDFYLLVYESITIVPEQVCLIAIFWIVVVVSLCMKVVFARGFLCPWHIHKSFCEIQWWLYVCQLTFWRVFYLCTYVCMCVCMYVFMYSCPYICLYVCICMHVCMHACMCWLPQIKLCNIIIIH